LRPRRARFCFTSQEQSTKRENFEHPSHARKIPGVSGAGPRRIKSQIKSFKKMCLNVVDTFRTAEPLSLSLSKRSRTASRTLLSYFAFSGTSVGCEWKDLQHWHEAMYSPYLISRHSSCLNAIERTSRVRIRLRRPNVPHFGQGAFRGQQDSCIVLVGVF
jgi:hypothetical protein